ncbi:MAG TPA: glycosyltransferase [Dermatophilaceae bacterium]|nr:glycosyltransferase [Dermatophilaceae bacterium]
MISALLAVWAGDRPEWVDEALRSLQAQTRPADQIVVVEDGPIADELSLVLDDAGQRLPITRVRLPHNRGLSDALQAGLPACEHELVARVDADDICVPERFERQLAAFAAQPELAALGGFCAEFVDDPMRPYAIRTVPVGADEVDRVARWRSPLNHPTVMLRRSAVLAVGGYDGFVGIEDYYLWAKLIVAGYRIDNLAEVLVRQRAGPQLGRRRGGWRYARTEAKLLWQFTRIGFLSRPQAVAGMAMRVPVRLVPNRLRSGIYRRLLRRDAVSPGDTAS